MTTTKERHTQAKELMKDFDEHMQLAIAAFRAAIMKTRVKNETVSILAYFNARANDMTALGFKAAFAAPKALGSSRERLISSLDGWMRITEMALRRDCENWIDEKDSENPQ